ncbi:MAG: tetratricopeptide repeat protein [Planctomycetales bacterium]|nr:tetratricopeptide repeat protein [Planctomycetales bacterium]MBN8627304.1 tetratricopeptide repeat protein [Planctomycetota bacterium]
MSSDGRCSTCRHANHDTDDAAEGFWACPWIGAVDPEMPCRVRCVDNGAAAYELYDGRNGTWGCTGSPYRETPQGYEHRLVIIVDDREDRVAPRESLPLIVNEHEVFCYVDFGSWWKRLLTGGCEGSGSLCLTDRRLVFVKSTARQRLACRGPLPTTGEELTQILVAQGGRGIPLDAIGDARVTAKGRGTYGGYGVTNISELVITFGEPLQTIRFRFGNEEGADRFMQHLRSGSQTRPASPVEDELRELEIPIDIGLPVAPQDAAWVTWLRATTAFALRTYHAGKYSFAVGDAEKLISDPRLQSDTRFALILAAAHYIRGIALEALGRHDDAREAYRQALNISPDYSPARRRMEVGRG